MLRKLSKQQRQSVVLYGATLLGTVAGVLASIVNTRFLDPADYGDVRYVQNIINLVSQILLFGYFLSGSRLLALTNDEQRARRVRGTMVVILAIASLILVLSLVVTWWWHRSNPHLAWLFIISIPVCFQPLYLNYINTTAQGDNHIGRLAFARFWPAFIYVPVAYWLYSTYGVTSERMIMLQWGLYTIIFLLIIISTRPSFRNLKPIFYELNKENKSYGLQLYWGALFMTASGYLAGLFLGLYNDNNTNVGFYTLALTVTAPLAFLPTIIGTSYFKRFATEPRIPKKILRFTIFLTVMGCVLFILLIHPLVKFLYSERYEAVGIYASWLAVGVSIRGLGDMLNRYLGSHGQGASIRNSSIYCGIVKIFGFAVLVKFWDINGALITMVVSDLIYAVTMTYYYIKFVKHPVKNEV